ncbi:MAG: peptide deformylase [Bacteroidetes bacterium]|nr:peptide deformylase [Bacteroidota bacterium]
MSVPGEWSGHLQNNPEVVVAILPIYTLGQSVLRKKARPVKGVDERIRQLAQDMLETMHKANGVGLAANQVGVLQRILVVDITGTEGVDHFDPLVMINPEVMDQEGKVAMEEGCLSLPELRDEVVRAERIKVRYRDIHFEQQTLEVQGMLSRVIQHELDHLNGVLFIDRLGPVRRRMLRGRLNKIEKGDIEVTYDVAPIQEPVAHTA